MIKQNKIAYFCMEYGLHESLTIFSGGLGVLAGDTLKAARDAHLDLIGIGILWDQGYTEQRIDADGKPYDCYPKTLRTTLERVDIRLEVVIEGRKVALTAYLQETFGNAPIYLLEPINEEDKWITQRLYGGAARERVAQEIVLGVGGVRLLRALGRATDVYHFNEGHAVFAGLELLREQMLEGLSFDEARIQVKDKVVFTTHTPVPAGNEKHCLDLLEKMGAVLAPLTRENLATLGGEPFQMTVAALRLCRVANAVAQLHGRTARKMWSGISDAAPILSITNGVHLPTWQDGRIAELVSSHGNEEQLWAVHQQMKAELLEEIEKRTGVKLDLNVLLTVFARRAATYKRATLVLRDLEWLEPLLVKGKLQLVFAGKAHPQDHEGKAIIERIVAMAERYPKQIVFLENYDMLLGRLLTRGADVWLNTPTRPMEASGTSGMKAALNGGLNVSVLDGWWDEGCDHGGNGWQFGDAYQGDDADARDLAALQTILDQEVLPCYYNGKARWAGMMRKAIGSAREQFSARRMLEDYVRKLYVVETP